jgi:hypothetical protein
MLPLPRTFTIHSAIPSARLEDDHGRYRYSLADKAPSFETVPFALAVAAQELLRSIGARQ